MNARRRTWFLCGVLGLAGAATSVPVAVAGNGKQGGAGFAKPPVKSPPAQPPAPMGQPVPIGRGFGGNHTDRPFSSLGTNRPLAPTGTGRPLAPSGSNRPLAPTGKDRPLAPIGGGGPGAAGPDPGTQPTFPGHGSRPHYHGRTVILVDSTPAGGSALEPTAPEPDIGIDSGAGFDASVSGEPAAPGEPGSPGLEPAAPAVATSSIDPIKLEMAQRLRADGHAQFLRREFHLAEPNLQSAVDLVPELNEARFELAFALLANGRVNSAAKEFVRAAAHDPLPFRAALDAPAMVGSDETFELCRQRAELYAAAYPMDSDALFVHALMQWWSGKAREAGTDLANLAGADPSYAGLTAAFVAPALDEALKAQ